MLAAIDYEGKDEAAVGEVDDKIVVDPERFISQHSQS